MEAHEIIAVSTICSAILSSILSGTISNFISRKSAHKQRIRSRKENICRKVEDIDTIASSYWIGSGQDSQVENQITLTLDYLNQDIFKLFGEAHDINDEIVKLRKVSTGGDFGVKNRCKELSRVDEIRSVCLTIRKLVLDHKP